jgi:hypothetical protein
MIDDFAEAGRLLIDQAVIHVSGSNSARRTGVGDQFFSFASRQKGREIAARRNERGGIGIDLAS